jgi:hypothetical protein
VYLVACFLGCFLVVGLMLVVFWKGLHHHQHHHHLYSHRMPTKYALLKKPLKGLKVLGVNKRGVVSLATLKH